MSQPEKTVKLGPGYLQIELSSWGRFVDYMCGELLQYGSYIWRGHRSDAWKLEPTIDRLIKSSELINRYTFQKEHLEKFKFAVRGRRGANPPEIKDENEWWALGQHHGLATPLLDWTASPFVAAYFAFSEASLPGQSKFRTVFALHSPSLEGWVTKKVSEQQKLNLKRIQEIQGGGRNLGVIERVWLESDPLPELVIVRPLSDENQRLINQGGLFTRLNQNTPLEDWITANHPQDDESISLFKFLIPDSDRDDFLRALARMNINPLSLFPDLYGASRYCNIASEIANY